MFEAVKCVIFDRDRRPDTVYVKKSTTRGSGAFSHAGHRYQLDSSRYLITKTYRYGIPIEYVTLYYRQGRAKPIDPIPPRGEDDDADIMTSREWELVRDEDLWDVLRGNPTTKKDQFMFYLAVATAAGVGYLVLGL